MKHYTREEFRTLFAGQQRKVKYQKNGEILYRPAQPNETVVTILNGRVETLSKAGDNHLIAFNVTVGGSGEKYTISRDRFEERYKLLDGEYFIEGHHWRKARAKGCIVGVLYMGMPCTFDAPWGEKMFIQPGDILASPITAKQDISEYDPNDLYRIEKEAFEQTYRKF